MFYNLHDLLVGRYSMKPSLHMNTYEMLAIFLFTCSGNESNRKGQNRFKHSGETISRKFDEVLNSLMAMAKDFIRAKDPSSQLFMRGLEMTEEHFHTSKIALVLLMAHIFELLCHPKSK